MPTDEYDDLEALARAATPGPWYAETQPGNAHRSLWIGDPEGGIGFCQDDWRDEDADFIAAADPSTVLALLDERRALIEKNREYEALLRERERLYPSEVRGWTRRVRAALAQSPRGDE